MKPQYLFVYGTLRRNAKCSQHASLLHSANFVAEASYQARLYLVDYYPGAVASDSAKDRVIGEVYQLIEPSQTLAKLDQYEGCGEGFAVPTEYLRLVQQVRLSSGEIVDAWVYVYNQDTDMLEQIKSGDFLRLPYEYTKTVISLAKRPPAKRLR